MVAVRYSLNEPLVETAEFPGAAARAAILVYLEDNLRRVVVVLRSSDKGRVVQYEMSDEDYRNATGAAFDAGLTFAESMGFLFDDEQLAGTTGKSRAAGIAPLARLLDLRVPLRMPTPPAANTKAPSAGDSASGSPDTIALDVDLTKFRGVGEQARDAAAEAPLPGATLGRVQPVRKLAPEPPAISPKLQLLASF